jgi:hypothetical protein
VYVESEDFNEKMAPQFFTTEMNKRKKLIAWYKQSCEVPTAADIYLAA